MKKKKEEESLLNYLPVKDYTGGVNWLIPVTIILLILLGLIIMTKDFYLFIMSKYNIVEKFLN